MGKKDVLTVEYLAECEHFADMFNAAFFDGKEVIKKNELEDAASELKDNEIPKGAEVRRDNVKKWLRGTQLAILVIEDQSNIDYHMVIRNLYAEGLYYRNEWKKRKNLHRKSKDLVTQHEFISGMKQDDKFEPLVNLVVYFGEEPWEGPRTLEELLDLSGENACLRPYVNNYHLNLFDYHDYENFEGFQSELRIVFEFLRYAKDKNALRKIVAEHSENYYNVSNETYQMIAVLTNSTELLKCDEKYENEEGGWNMCKALEDIRLEGIEEGIKEGIKEGEGLLADLISRLFLDDRTEDAKLAARDEEARKRFYREYGMID